MSTAKRLLLIGATGFIGKTVADHFSSTGWQVFGVDRIERPAGSEFSDFAHLALPDARLNELLLKWRPDACIHAAGAASVWKSMEDPVSDYMAGPFLTFNLLDAIRINSPQCAFILLSSAAVYGNPDFLPVAEDAIIAPISAYGYHKWQSEIICTEYSRLFGLRTASTRIFSAYGPGLRRQVMWDIVHKALTQKEVYLQGTGQESRDFIHVEDIARGLETILKNAPLHGETYNLSNGTETSIADLSMLICKHIDRPVQIVFSNELPPGTPRNWCADISAISRLGYAPQMDLDQGVAGFVEWSRNEIIGA